MLQVLNDIQLLQDKLEALRSDGKIVDYKITLKLNLKVHILLFVESHLSETIADNPEAFLVEEILIVDLENDSRYREIFDSLKAQKSKSSRIDLGIRRRFSRLINPNATDTTEKLELNIPILTFYSYKGGMGRSTTLASFASYIALHHKKKVLVIDCDFEAPGFTNYFDLNQEKIGFKNGIVEYLIDRQYKNGPLDFSKYIIEVSKEYSNEGAIYVMPAGNLTELPVSESSTSTHREHYLEALARLDISSSKFIIHQFNTLLNDISISDYKPDIILIDSRTGFNDIFAVTALTLSDVVVGFFGNNEQTKPGLQYFIDTAMKMERPYNVILVNSIISDRAFFDEFKKDAENYIALKSQDQSVESNSDNENEGQILIPEYFRIERNTTLERLGTRTENKLDFIELIGKKGFLDYNKLFDALCEKVNDIGETVSVPEIMIAPAAIPIISIPETQQFTLSPSSESVWNLPKLSPQNIVNMKRSLLEEISLADLKPYAENQVFDEAFINRHFYFRPKIYDIFNKDKFLVIGGKGTGKTTLYRALSEDIFVEKLKFRSGKTSGSYYTTQIISLENERPLDKYFKVAANWDVTEIKDYERYFTRFWKVYVWNALLIDIHNGKYLHHLVSKFENVSAINNDEKTSARFREYITSDEKMLSIDSDMKLIDSELENRNENLVILFDQLDKICKPIDWDKCVAPLINYWRANQFSRILPKIFLRADLFNKLGNITNKQELRSQNIDIEWSQEEIFSFFFKWVLSTSSGQFGNLIRQYGDYPKSVIDEITSKTKHFQVPTQRKLLEPYVNTFFGKYADRMGKDAKFGLSYDWFFANLKNADDTISLRPFLDLISEAIELALNASSSTKPILPAFFYAAPEVRKKAVRRHFEDLADEEGNDDLKIVFNHISKLAPGSPFKKSYLKKREFDGLLTDIITNNASIQHNEIDSLKSLLIVNGIVAEIQVGGAYLNYRFAFLYKYFLGLK